MKLPGPVMPRRQTKCRLMDCFSFSILSARKPAQNSEIPRQSVKTCGMSRPDVDSLQNETLYRKILELDFSEMTPFVLNHIGGKEKAARSFLVINLATAIFIVIYIAWGLTTDHLDGGRIFWQILGGIFSGSILIIAPHELLHGLAYRLLGTRHIRFGVDFQQFIFFVTADRFPISRNELYFLALTPFAVINAAIISMTAIWFTEWTLLSATLLLSHNIMCIGDFALLSFANKHKGEIYTYDEIENKKSYFYEKIKAS